MTLPKSTPGTGGTDGTVPGMHELWERIETLTDSVATANRAALRHQQELVALRQAVIIALVLAGAYFILHSRKATIT